MSRTDKDRPQWVRAQDPLERRLTAHQCTPASCRIDLPARSRVEWWGHGCMYYVASSKWHWGRVTHRAKERARVRMYTHAAVRWHRADPDGFAADFDHGPHVPWRDYWMD